MQSTTTKDTLLVPDAIFTAVVVRRTSLGDIILVREEGDEGERLDTITPAWP